MLFYIIVVIDILFFNGIIFVYVCVYVCVSERERERERKRMGERGLSLEWNSV